MSPKHISRAILLATLGFASPALAEDWSTVPKPTLLWAATQFLPSPGLHVIRQDAYFTMRWQITPLLYSFHLRRRVNPWRFLIAEPNVRQGGSIELFLSPEFTAYPGNISDKWGLRSGIRTYFPLVERGEGLSVSLGASHLYFHGEHSMGIEAGAYVLFGFLGLQMTYSPRLLGSEAWMASLRVRYF